MFFRENFQKFLNVFRFVYDRNDDSVFCLMIHFYCTFLMAQKLLYNNFGFLVSLSHNKLVMKKAFLITEASVYKDKNGRIVSRGGGEGSFHSIAKALLKKGIRPMVFAIQEVKGQGASGAGQAANEEIEGVKYERYPVKSKVSLGILRYLKAALKKARDYDYVFLNQFTPHLILPFLKGKISKVEADVGVCKVPKLIAVVHDVYKGNGWFFWFKHFGFLSGIFGPLVERFQMNFDKKYADVIMTNSESTKGKIVSACGRSIAEKIVVNPMPASFDSVNAEKALLIKESPPKENILLFVGRAIGYKHPEHVLYVLKKVREKFPNFKAVFVRSRIEKSVAKKFEKLRKKLMIGTEAIEFVDNCPLSELYELYAKAKILVHPSYIEGQGIVVSEAGLLGTPVIAYDLKAYEGVLENGFNSLLVKVGDFDALSTACVEILENYSLYSENCIKSFKNRSDGVFADKIAQICHI